MKDYYDDVEMPGGRLKIEFHGDRGTSEQILMIPFRDGDDVKYFVVGGVREGYRRVTRYDMVRVMGLGSIDRVSRGCLGGDVGHNAIQAESRLDEHAIEPKPASQHPTFISPPFFSG